MTSAFDVVSKVFREGGDLLDMLRAAGTRNRRQCVAMTKGVRVSRHVRICKWDECGEEFETTDSRQVYCCEDHRRSAEYARDKKTRKAIREQKTLNPVVSDPFIRPDFYGADGLPGMHSQVCPMEGMYSQSEQESAKEAA